MKGKDHTIIYTEQEKEFRETMAEILYLQTYDKDVPEKLTKKYRDLYMLVGLSVVEKIRQEDEVNKTK